ncbi:ubiquitin carboxyl-terminal hydrolase 28 isoform X1 [Protopterus annectens]|nr:ubiquitin carboxyl-terminal hydrolase 28 isoform X1 [Protopterus annectens]
MWGENANPNDWRRTDNWPVGLKNVGNTCWFNAVIQSLFHLPEFRRLILNCQFTKSILESNRNPCEKRNLAFMMELRSLFSLMLASNRKFVDPSPALGLLKDAFRTTEAQQQDVSEFTHKLLDWLEDALQIAANINNRREKNENPMVQLFYGTFLAEGIHDGKPFSNVETFGQYPLQVNGYCNLNECLEGAVLEGEIESLHSDQSSQSGQEHWFTKLPPVLTFELSRFEFNQSLGQPEKIHKKLEFPQVIYMDRYLHKNKEFVRSRKEEVRKMKEHLSVLKHKLDRYMNYGSGPYRFPLSDMLQYVLEFASTKPTCVPPSPDRQVFSPPPVPELDTPLPNAASPVQASFSDVENRGTSGSDSLETVPSPQQSTVDLSVIETKFEEFPAQPAPHTITQEELQFIEGCLQRWRSEVEHDIRELKENIAKILCSIEQIYSHPVLSQVPYQLHAVLVHEGQAVAGHYWAYVYDHIRMCWMKYNDISVTESSWDELQRDSYGGQKNASAYCLMYINKNLPHLIAEHTDANPGQAVDGIHALPQDLKFYVEEDNLYFEHEVEEWLEEESCKIPAATSESQEFSSGTSEAPVSPSSQAARSLSSEHAVISKEQTAQAIANTAESFEKNGVEAALNDAQAEGSEKQETQADTEVATEEKGSVNEKETETQTSIQVSEVEIPSVGKLLVRHDSDGYDEEVMLSPAMQGVILAIAKSRQAFDRDGPEAGLIKAFHEEYSRLYHLAKEEPISHNDPRLQHVLVYFFQNEAPKRVIERTLLEQFADRNLSYDERSISIMKIARARLKQIGPEDMDMDEYKSWHEDYSLFRKVSVYLLTGLEHYQHGRCREALTYLVYAYQHNSTLLMKGQNRGVDENIIALYRRKCLLELNEKAATLFESGDDSDVTEGLNLMNELIIPCMHLMINNDICQQDLDAIEVLRSRWCSYLGQDIDENLQQKLSEFLPRMLDCSAEIIVLKEPPKIRPTSPHDLCSRFAAVMESIHSGSAVTVT